MKSQDHKWYLDSGATKHYCPDRTLFRGYCELETPQNILVADGKSVAGVGTGEIIWQDECLGESVTLKDVLYAPAMNQSLISVARITENGFTVKFTGDQAEILSKDEKCVFGRAKRCGQNVYEYAGHPVGPERADLAESESDLQLWHRRLGHVNAEALMKMSREGLVNGLNLKAGSKLEFCSGCALGKQTRQSFPKNEATRAKQLLEIVHSDVCGPMPEQSLGGKRYFVSFIDDKSRLARLYFLKQKSEAFECFREYKAWSEKQTGCKLKNLRSDNGTEFVNGQFSAFLKAEGIQRQLTMTYTPEQNGVAERYNRTVVESARSMLQSSGLTGEYWAEAVANAMCVRNCSYTHSVDRMVPHEAFFGRKPSVERFRVFGCVAYTQIPKEKRRKLDPKSKKVLFMGYTTEQKGYRFFNCATKCIELSRDAIFDEKSLQGPRSHEKQVTFALDDEESEAEPVGAEPAEPPEPPEPQAVPQAPLLPAPPVPVKQIFRDPKIDAGNILPAGSSRRARGGAQPQNAVLALNADGSDL